MNASAPEPARRALAIRKMITEFQQAIRAPERCHVPVIVAVHGPVIGLGIDMICSCDIRFASSDALFTIKVRVLHQVHMRGDCVLLI
jgi:delta(3,5)-delta(2,4)-dienoyl-CoA isomerase